MPKRKKRERRAPGSGYASQTANGTWRAVYPKFGGGSHVRRGFDTRAAAEAWLDSLAKHQAEQGNVGGGQKRTDVWLDDWATRNAKEREWKAKMIADVQWKLGYVKPYIGAMALIDVQPDHVDAIWTELRKSLAENTVRQIRNYLYQVFEEARARRYITFNPVIKPPRRKRPKQKDPQRLSAPQVAVLLLEAEQGFYGLAWWLILLLGLRAGEACGLRWGDVDLERCILHIEQEITDVRGRSHQDTPKNDKKRHLPFPRALAALFGLHRAALLKRAAKGVRAGTWKEHGLVFPGRSGMPMNPTSLRHQLKDMTDAKSLPPVTTHMLRHTAGKFYTDVGTDHFMTKAILGHAPDITGHYAPPDPESMRPHVERVYSLIAGEVQKARMTG